MWLSNMLKLLVLRRVEPMAKQVGTIDRRSLRYAGRREQLLRAATDWVLEHGLEDLAIRPLAAGLGISHRTLLHHFSSKDRLIAEVLREVRRRNEEFLAETAWRLRDQDPDTIVQATWEHFVSTGRRAHWRLFFEVYGLALTHPERYEPFFDGLVTGWVDQTEELLLQAGVPAARATRLATLIVATVRGLILDLLVTDDEDRVHLALAELGSIIVDARDHK
jgi:AcrR family transcriptional regulator